jgi:hypothetical protein
VAADPRHGLAGGRESLEQIGAFHGTRPGLPTDDLNVTLYWSDNLMNRLVKIGIRYPRASRILLRPSVGERQPVW